MHSKGRALSGITTFWFRLWVNPASHLPVHWEIVVTAIYGHQKASHIGVLNDDVQWRPPTAANLAELTIPVLAGFTQVARPSPHP